jgi:hypothetical protein
MKKVLVAAVLIAGMTSILVAAPPPQFGKSQKGDNTKLLLGKVLDRGDNPLPNAVVYLTNTRTRAVKTYIAGQDGSYRFPALQPGIDYQVYAQFNGKKSDTKSVSQFDDRQQISIVLKIDNK